MTLTKADLVQALTEGIGLNRREAADMVEAFFEEVARQLEAGDPVKLSGFGNFGLRTKDARPGRNPKTGEAAIISARRVVTFHPSQKLVALIAERQDQTLASKVLSRLSEKSRAIEVDIDRV